jgi:hypothetical protein
MQPPQGGDAQGSAPQQPYSQPPGQPAYTPEPRNGLGIGALICGVLGMLFGLIPFTGFIAFALGAVGVILGLSARGRLKRGRADNTKVTWAGVITSVLAIALGIWGMVVVFTAVDQFGQDMEDLSQEFDSYAECIENAETAEEMAACD